MKKINNLYKILFSWQMLLCALLGIFIELTVSQISEIEFTEMLEPNLIHWFMEAD